MTKFPFREAFVAPGWCCSTSKYCPLRLRTLYHVLCSSRKSLCRPAQGVSGPRDACPSSICLAKVVNRPVCPSQYVLRSSWEGPEGSRATLMELSRGHSLWRVGDELHESRIADLCLIFPCWCSSDEAPAAPCGGLDRCAQWHGSFPGAEPSPTDPFEPLILSRRGGWDGSLDRK